MTRFRLYLMMVCCTAVTAAAVPRLVNFSGTLTGASGQPLAGVVGVTFSLYDAQEGGAPVWMETQNVQTSSDGRYSVLLGATRNEGIPAETFASGQRWLGVAVAGEPERPRVLMTSVPYSLKAVDAETLGGLPASAFALAGTASHSPSAEVAGAPAKTSQPAADATPAQTGSGTANYITIWTGTTTLGNSKLYQTTAGNVGLGTTTPTARLQAVTSAATGTAVFGNAASTTGANFGVTGKTASTTGTGVLGEASATSGVNYGVSGSTASPAGVAVYGNATATTGAAYGVSGLSASPAGVGVIGYASAASGADFGVYGATVSPQGIGVEGTATEGTGVAGVTAAAAGYGVYGVNTATTGNAFGVYGGTASPAGSAVFGINTATTLNAYGVNGETASTGGVAVRGVATATSGSTYGIYGAVLSPSGVAVSGVGGSGTGVAGSSTSPTAYARLRRKLLDHRQRQRSLWHQLQHHGRWRDWRCPGHQRSYLRRVRRGPEPLGNCGVGHRREWDGRVRQQHECNGIRGLWRQRRDNWRG